MKRFLLLPAILLTLFLTAISIAADAAPKYVILLIGDGMGPTIRQYYQHEYPDSSLETFPVTLKTGTNNHSGTTTDSAASGTAIACGIKTYNSAIGVTPDKQPVTSLAKIFRDNGYSVGIITSVGLNDATPAAHYSNRITRKDYAGTLSDLIASDFNFFAGGRLLMPKDYKLKNYANILKKCNYELREEFVFDDKTPSDRVMFLGNMSPNWDDSQPQKHILRDVTNFALKSLNKNPKGFFLMVEGGAIDHGGHNNDLAYTMREMREFDQTVKLALDFAKKHPAETLIIVTSDHDTGGLNLHKLPEKSCWKNQKRASGAIEKDFLKRFGKASDDELIKFLADEYALTDLTAAEEKTLRDVILEQRDPKKRDQKVFRSMYGRYNPAVVAARRLRDSRCGVSWTHFSHTSRQVLTNVDGIGKEHFAGVKENSDIPHAISRAVFGKDLMVQANKTVPLPPAKNAEEYFKFISATPDSLTFRYGQQDPAETEFIFEDRAAIKRNDRAGRITFGDLKPGKNYTLTVKRNGKIITECKGTTPVKPQGKLLAKFGIVSDAHLSLMPDVRFGRLHSKSIEAMQSAIADLNPKTDFIAMPGDVTDAGYMPEIKALDSILKLYPKGRFYAVPGNHDLMNRAPFRKQWLRLFGEARVEKYNDIQILLLNTWNGKLMDKEENLRAFSALAPQKPVIVFSHYQLVADSFIKDKAKVISDTAEAREVLQKLSAMKGMIFVGHKNVATTAKLGDMLQINLPQLTQYPAGYIYAEMYSDGILLQFCSSLNVFFDEYSRLRGWVFKQNSQKRDLYSFQVWNAFYPVNFSGNN